MKRILIVGLCLVSGAAIYGFVDYLKTDKQQLEQQYKEAPPVVTQAAVKENIPETPVVTAKEELPTIVTSNNGRKNDKVRHPKRFSLKQYSRAKLDEIPLHDSATGKKDSRH
jgi:hypothetical protein